MNEPTFNLNTIAIRQQWLPPGVSNCMVFIFKNRCEITDKVRLYVVKSWNNKVLLNPR